MNVITSALLGLGTGAVIASVALGLVLTHRASGVVNFAQGAMASWCAYTYYSLHNDGSLPIPPLPLVPRSVGFGAPVGTSVALGITLVLAAGMGVVVYWVVFRPLRNASSLAKIAAAVGVTLFFQASIVIDFGFRARTVAPIVRNRLVSLGAVSLGMDRFILLAIVVLLAIALHVLFVRTRFGIAARAATNDERSALLLGVSVDRLASATWAMASVISALVGVIASAITGLTPNLLSLTIIPALAAALVAGFRSFGRAAAVGIALGMMQSLIVMAEVRVPWWPDLKLGTPLPFVVIAVCMIIAGRSLPERGAADGEHLPVAYCPPLTRMRLSGYTTFVAVIVLAVIVLPFDYRTALNYTMIGVLLALSLVVVTGFAGQVSLVQMAFAGIGAFTVATVGLDAGMPTLVTLPAAVVAATAIGIVMGIPSLRARGASLAVLTLAAGVALQDVVLTRDGWFGSANTRQAPTPSVFGVDLGTSSPLLNARHAIPSPAFGLFLLSVTVIAAVAVMRIRRISLGAQMLTVRANEKAAAATGVNVAAIKLASFAIGAAIAGMAGAMMAYGYGSFTAKPFDYLTSLTLLAIAYLGGISTVGGAVWAGTLWTGGLFVVLQDQFYDAGQYTGYVAGIGLVVTAVMYPEGIDGAVRESVRRLWARLPKRRGEQHAPTPAETVTA
jgi:ABC-type branched-subunit amino acid transport system permease subunit